MVTAKPLVLNIPREFLLTSNQRAHWAKKARKTAAIRTLAYLEARQANLQPFSGRQQLTVTVAWPDRRHRDTPNIYPTVKAAVDGIVGDAGLLPDDSDRWLVGPDMRPASVLADKRVGCTLTFEFTQAAA